MSERKVVGEYEGVTLYMRSEFGFGYRGIECRTAKIEVGKYAQYDAAVFVTFIPRGKRKPRALVLTYKPSLVVLDGTGHKLEQKMFGEEITTENTDGTRVITSQSKHLSHDPAWDTEFGGMLEAYVANTNTAILHDFRDHDPHGAPLTPMAEAEKKTRVEEMKKRIAAHRVAS